MWQCSECRTKVEDRYQHCWNCGHQRTLEPNLTAQAVPQFSSFEELAPEPRKRNTRPSSWDLFITLILATVFRVVVFPFLGRYSIYISIILGIFAIGFILWRVFRHDPQEGVGIKLN